jgi:hypothetical protein
VRLYGVEYHLRKSVCLNRMPSSSSWMQIAFLIVYGSPFLRMISWCSLVGMISQKTHFRTKEASRYWIDPLQSQPMLSGLVM